MLRILYDFADLLQDENAIFFKKMNNVSGYLHDSTADYLLCGIPLEPVPCG